MYTSSDDDRSDLFLTAAVFVLGPELLGIILRRLPPTIAVSPVVSLIVTVLTTIALPLWLMRYRKQPLSHLGFDRRYSAAGAGLLVAAPVVAAYVVAELIGRTPVYGAVPLLAAFTNGAYVVVALSFIRGLCVAFVAIYVTVKARSAFRADPGYIKSTMTRLAKFVGVGSAIATLLLVVTFLSQGSPAVESTEIVLAPLGVAGAGWLAHRWASGSQLTSRATLLTPMVLLAIGAFVIFAQALAVVAGLWSAALLAGIGLVIGVLLESQRSAWAPVGFAATLALLTPLL